MSLPRCVLEGTTYLITRRCLGRHFLLRPDPALNQVFVYCLGRAAKKYGVRVHAVGVMSNHYHLVLTDVRAVLPAFMQTLNRSLAMCIKRLRQWEEVLFEPHVSYSAVELRGDKEILDKVAYTVLNPVSAALVRTPARWPGVLSTLEVLKAGKLEATRPALWFRADAPDQAKVRFSVPSVFGSREHYFGALEALLAARLRVLHREHRRRGLRYFGRASVLGTRVTDRPRTQKPRLGRSPTFSALTRARWLEAVKRLRAFRLAYRAAYQAWRRGDRDTEFPCGTWWVVRYAGAAVVG